MAETAQAMISIEGMNCQHCVETVMRALSGVAGVAGVNVDLAAKRAEVKYDPQAASAAKLMQAVGQAGFKATGFTRARA